jgi:hypothetical protein
MGYPCCSLKVSSGPRYLHLPAALPPTEHKTLKTANLGLVECRNFHSVTVTGHLCRSVELVQRVTVTGVCQIEQNGTVPYWNPRTEYVEPMITQIQIETVIYEHHVIG